MLRYGTRVNGTTLVANEAAEVKLGDELNLGASTFKLQLVSSS